MQEKTESSKSKNMGSKAAKTGGAGGWWFLGFIGTLVYYLHFHSGTFWLVLIAIFKAIFWPVFLVYNLFKFMGV